MNFNNLVHCLPILGIAIASVSISPVSADSFSPKSQVIAQSVKEVKQVNEKDLIETAKTINEFRKKRDVTGIMNYVAPFAISKILYEYETGSQTINLEGKASHQEFIEKAFKDIKSSNSKNLQVRYRISADGNVGTVNSYSIAAVTTDKGKQYIVTSDEVFNFAMVGDQLVLISFDSKNRFDPRPDKK